MFAELVFVAVGPFGLCERGFIGAELVIDHLPYHFVVLHVAALLTIESNKIDGGVMVV